MAFWNCFFFVVLPTYHLNKKYSRYVSSIRYPIPRAINSFKTISQKSKKYSINSHYNLEYFPMVPPILKQPTSQGAKTVKNGVGHSTSRFSPLNNDDHSKKKKHVNTISAQSLFARFSMCPLCSLHVGSD